MKNYKKDSIKSNSPYQKREEYQGYGQPGQPRQQPGQDQKKPGQGDDDQKKGGQTGGGTKGSGDRF